MKPAAFDYHRPSGIAEAIDMLWSLENARVLAGGQSLMPMLNMRLAAVDHLIDINRIAELNGIELNEDTVRVGAVTRQAALLDHAGLRRRDPIVAEALEHVGHLPTRTRGTIGGSLAHMDPAAELMGLAAVHDATLHVRGKAGLRSIPIGEFPVDFLAPDIAAGELLVDVEWPLWPARHGSCFLEFAYRHGDFAIVGVAVLILLSPDNRVVERVAIALVGVDKGPVRLREAEDLLAGSPPTEAAWQEAADIAGRVEPLSDAMATPRYRQRLARVLVRRALQIAAARAGTQAGIA
jgi:aerobic carbon-monoxide dehydrogenase medium subunit